MSLVRCEDAAGVATLWLERPERGNALGLELVAALDAAVTAALVDGARCLVLRGAGRHFCTGFDLSDLDQLSDGDLLLRVVRIEQLLQRLHAAPVVTVAVGQGRSFGAGADLFAVCDHRIAMAGASFAFPGPSFGLVLGTARLAARIGAGRAREVLLGGESLDAEAALAAGLATAVLEEAALPAALARIGAAASRLAPETVAGLHARTRGADDDADLAALVRSAARPGLKQRILEYRAAVAAQRKG
ncbi:enoyl-CoA hydratase/isomerase family protein [Siccirubricoccus sp. KC 17139]|uniref:Enoyl-CoA hydratase/isomerase family protein n=1 Tax=Siccirubricoccus soli TaxID=2899147 RepID=A0ABT1CZD9_9PROT|nr:enoyl-CoA hydratase/isomerase family protein [Siccirubricoccus soli]MCO6415021.1 enoyl-CoA hydratase/isomerase family protein [Siccirubricoccus soli]MCP2681152.1 enoyl-CoA hydratase/isomerase family protein [Siccirubricoccus soli]